jgi:hypothetical protein
MSGGNDEKVLLDLNYPEFQSTLFDLDINELKKVIKTFKKLRSETWNGVFRDQGLKWEAIKSMPGKFSIRLSQSCRAVVVRDRNMLRFQILNQDHDGAYGKK